MARVQEWFRGYEEKGEEEKIKFVGEYEINGLERKKLGGNFCFETSLFSDSLAKEKKYREKFPRPKMAEIARSIILEKNYIIVAHIRSIFRSSLIHMLDTESTLSNRSGGGAWCTRRIYTMTEEDGGKCVRTHIPSGKLRSPPLFLVIKANINSSRFVLFKLVRPPQTPFTG